MNSFVYHLHPKEMVGDYLYPLNQLREKAPDVYAAQAQKYKGREQLLERIIPPLNCLWNDVLHLSPVHPAAVRDALLAAGYNRYPQRWWQIDPEEAGFSDQNTAIYLYSPRKRGNFDVPPDDFVPFSMKLLAKINKLPQATADYYREMEEEGKQAFLFHLVPHILHRGAIRISDLSTIEV